MNNTELRLEADNSERRLIELDFLFKGGVRRMIAAKNRQGPVRDSLNNRINIACVRNGGFILQLVSKF